MSAEEGNSKSYSISVLIPYYKADQFFDECIYSVLNQTYKPAEIIVVNDNSGEASRKFLAKYEAVARVIHLEKSHGAGGARNVALKWATSEWVAFQDADDIWELDKLESQIKALELNPTWVACHTGVKVFNDFGVIKEHISKPSPLRVTDLMHGSHVTPPSLMIKRAVINQLNGFDETFKSSEDYEFSLRLVKAGYLIGFLPKPLIKVRRANHGNLSSNGFKTLKGHWRLINKHRDTFLEYSGMNGIRRFLAKSIMETGGKLGGRVGKTIYYCGRILGL